MARSSKYTLVMFYNNSNHESLRARVAVNEFVSDSIEWADVAVEEFEFDRHKDLAREYGVQGTPAIVLVRDGSVVKRHFGEITPDELHAIAKESFS